jgi:aryl-alcohol dehydrogenase-like predicted oxidoreductase
MAQLAVAWVLQNDNVASAITGASHPDQVAANAEAAGHQFPPETLASIEEVLTTEPSSSALGLAAPVAALAATAAAAAVVTG